MKAYKRIMANLVVAFVVVLALSGVVSGQTQCQTNGAIPNVNISSHDGGEKEYAGEDVSFTCNSIPWEYDQCLYCGEWEYYTDGVTITWTAQQGSFKDNTGPGAIWTAPAKAPPPSGMVTITATANDAAKWANDQAKSDDVTIQVVDCESVDYTTGEKCEHCEWKYGDLFPYCGTPKYVEASFSGFVGCGSFPSVTDIILIQTTPTTWHVGLNDGVFANWNVYYGDPGEKTSHLELTGISCPAFEDYDLPVCDDGTGEAGPFTNVLYGSDCNDPCAGPCGYNGTADVNWGSDIGHTEYINQFPAWQSSVEYEYHPPFLSDRVRHSSKLYICIKTHTSSASNEPGVGQDWETYWAELPS